VYNTSGKDLIQSEIDALNMWVNKQHGIMPNQYHHFYDQGDTLIYPEHIADLLTIDKMYSIKIENEQKKKDAPKGVKDFFGQKFKYGGGGRGGNKNRK
jgi:hypothetical protein